MPFFKKSHNTNKPLSEKEPIINENDENTPPSHEESRISNRSTSSSITYARADEEKTNPQRTRNPQKTRNQHDVILVPLGGLGEIGRNMMAIEFGDDIIVIDAGVMFPDSNYPGIDLLLPDITYLKSRAKKIKALVITHGHEDHIGGVPYLLRDIPGIPIYAPQMALELIKGKLHEHRVRYDAKKLHPIQKQQQYFLSSSFGVEFVEVNHSIPDSYALAITTPIGVIVHTGDFKVELDTLENNQFDLHRFAELGQKGVLLLCSDSTNVEKKQEDRTESEILHNLEQMIQMAKGRVVISTFASNVNRVSKIVEMAEKEGKKVCLLGRNIENNFEIAQKLGYVKASKSTVIPYQNAKNHPEHKLIIISTGTQGETLSALTRMSQDLHKTIKLKKTDTIIISASVIPGNEKAISVVLDRLSTKTRSVYYSRNAPVHVSGHATQKDLFLMLRLIQPKFFMPVHGEKRFLLQHTYLAHRVGIPVNRTLVAQNGDIIQLGKQSLKIVKQSHSHPVLVQGNKASHYYPLVEQRLQISKTGVLFVFLVWDPQNTENSVVQTQMKGFLLHRQEHECQALIEKHCKELLQKQEEEVSLSTLESNFKKSIDNLLNSKYGKSCFIEVKMTPKEM